MKDDSNQTDEPQQESLSDSSLESREKKRKISISDDDKLSSSGDQTQAKHTSDVFPLGGRRKSVMNDKWQMSIAEADDKEAYDESSVSNFSGVRSDAVIMGNSECKKRKIALSDDEDAPVVSDHLVYSPILKTSVASKYSAYNESSFFDKTEASFFTISGPENECVVFSPSNNNFGSRQNFLASTFSLLRKYFTDGELKLGFEGQSLVQNEATQTAPLSPLPPNESIIGDSAASDILPNVANSSEVFQQDSSAPAATTSERNPSKLCVTDSILTEDSNFLTAPTVLESGQIFNISLPSSEDKLKLRFEGHFTEATPLTPRPTLPPKETITGATSQIISSSGVVIKQVLSAPTATTSERNPSSVGVSDSFLTAPTTREKDEILNNSLNLDRTQLIEDSSQQNKIVSIPLAPKLNEVIPPATDSIPSAPSKNEDVSNFLPEGFLIVPSNNIVEGENSNLSVYCDKLFTKAPSAMAYVKVFSCLQFNDEKLDSYFMSGLLTLTVHSLRLINMAVGDDQISEPLRYWSLLRLFQNTGREQLLDYKAVSKALGFDNIFMSRATLLFNFDMAVRICFVKFFRNKTVENRLYDSSSPFILDPITLESFTSTLNFVEHLRTVHDQKLNEQPPNSLPLDDRLIFVPVRNPNNDRVKSIPLRFRLAAELVYQTTGALYIHPNSLKTTVAILTRSKLEVFESKYALAQYTPSPDISRIVVQRSKILREEDPPTQTCIPCIQKDGAILVGFVLVHSKPQNVKMDNILYSDVLQWELSRKSAYGSFGNKEYRILSDEELWLNDEIINCMLGKLVDHFDFSRLTNWPISSAFFTYLVATNDVSSERLRVGTVKPKGMVQRGFPTINYLSVNKFFDAINPFGGDPLIIHIPINHKNNLHWSYVCLDCQTQSILLFDSRYQSPSPDQSGYIFKHIHCFLECLFRDRYPGDTPFFPWTVQLVKSPDQIDGNNCGVFMLINAARTMWQRHRKVGYNLSTPWDNFFTDYEKMEIRKFFRDVLFFNKGFDDIGRILKFRSE